MDEFKQRLVHLHHCRGIGWKAIFDILTHDPTLTSLFQHHHAPYLPTATQHQLFQDLQSKTIREQINQYRLNHIHVLTYFDEEYPALLKEIYQPPWVLYGKGRLALLGKEKLAVVGSRKGTEYGKKAIAELFPSLIKKGLVIVSGLAAGIDTAAHEGALEYGGETIAIIAGGLYHIYPKSNKDLALQIMKNHLVLSEYPPHTFPSRWQFPARNRIISGMSRGTFVVEAMIKSGSLITANFALEEGREVFALPGSIFDPLSAGTNDLIKQGAKLVQTADDIIEELGYL